MSTGAKRSTGKPQSASKEGSFANTKRSARAGKAAHLTGEITMSSGLELTKAGLTSRKGKPASAVPDRLVRQLRAEIRELKAEIGTLARRVVSLEQERVDQCADPESGTPEFIEDCAEIEHVLGKRFKSVGTRPLSAGQVAIDVTDPVFKGLSWMKRRDLLEPILATLSERTFFRVIETHLRTPDETI